MSEKLDWTQKLGDAFLAQQKDVMDTVQKLRLKAYGEGNLETTEQQKVVVEEETKTIIVESANPEVVYVPTYNPTVVYGAWPYPAYPPYYYYPAGWVPGAALFAFGVGVALGAAWGYAWGGCGWGRGEVNVNVNQNANPQQQHRPEQAPEQGDKRPRPPRKVEAQPRTPRAYRTKTRARPTGSTKEPPPGMCIPARLSRPGRDGPAGH